MDGERVNQRRRRFLTGAVSVVGGAGAIGAGWAFATALMPSERAKAAGAPVEVDISKLEPAQMLRVKWRGKPVWVLRRTEEQLETLPALDPMLRDPRSEEAQQPAYARNEHRSIKPEYLVLVGICTHLGCSPSYVRASAAHALGPDWKGGFFCPCHGSRFDLAGRVFQSVPAPLNLVVPPHTYLSDTRVLVGVDAS